MDPTAWKPLRSISTSGSCFKSAEGALWCMNIRRAGALVEVWFFPGQCDVYLKERRLQLTLMYWIRAATSQLAESSEQPVLGVKACTSLAGTALGYFSVNQECGIPQPVYRVRMPVRRIAAPGCA